MNTFRAFILDAAGRIVQSEVLSASNVEEAVEAAAAFSADHDLEVWRGDRRLALIRKGGEVDYLVRPDGPKK